MNCQRISSALFHPLSSAESMDLIKKSRKKDLRGVEARRNFDKHYFPEIGTPAKITSEELE